MFLIVMMLTIAPSAMAVPPKNFQKPDTATTRRLVYFDHAQLAYRRGLATTMRTGRHDSSVHAALRASSSAADRAPWTKQHSGPCGAPASGWKGQCSPDTNARTTDDGDNQHAAPSARDTHSGGRSPARHAWAAAGLSRAPTARTTSAGRQAMRELTLANLASATCGEAAGER